MRDLIIGSNEAMFADAVSRALQSHGFSTSGLASTPEAITALVQRQRPELLLLSKDFENESCLAMVTTLSRTTPGTRIVVVADHYLPPFLRQLLNGGVSGLVGRSVGLQQLADDLHRVCDGEVVVNLRSMAQPAESAEQRQARDMAAHLTPRERECLGMLVAGSGTRQMAADLGVSVTTVRTYVQGLLTKLNVHSRLEAALLANRFSLLAGSVEQVVGGPTMRASSPRLSSTQTRAMSQRPNARSIDRTPYLEHSGVA